MKNFDPADKNAAEYQKIIAEIHSDTSPVGIDAKHTHAVILNYLADIVKRLERLEKQLAGKQADAE